MAGPLAPAGAAALAVLVFIRTEGFEHPSIADGVAMIEDLGAAHGFTVETTDDNTQIDAATLEGFGVVVWLNTTGDVLDPPQEAAFERWVEGGGGWVGIHAAADCEYQWPWYGELLGNGAWFESHPAIQDAELAVDDFTHPSAGPWPAAFAFTEEWYNFAANPRPAVDGVVLTIDESTYDPGRAPWATTTP